MEKRGSKPWLLVILLLVVAVYMPVAGLGSLMWHWIYRPFIDAVDRNDPGAMALLAVFIVLFFIAALETRDRTP